MLSGWKIHQGKVEFFSFFRALPKHFPGATTFYVEGSSMHADAVKLFNRHIQSGDFLPQKGTLFPTSQKFRCTYHESLFSELVELSERRAEPEILDHLHIYNEEEPLLTWYDAFNSSILVSGTLPDDRVASFAAQLGLTYQLEK